MWSAEVFPLETNKSLVFVNDQSSLLYISGHYMVNGDQSEIKRGLEQLGRLSARVEIDCICMIACMALVLPDLAGHIQFISISAACPSGMKGLILTDFDIYVYVPSYC